MILPTRVVVKDMNQQKIIAIINLQQLHNFIVKFVSMEFSNLIESCYYPKVTTIYQDLLHICNTDERKLILYSNQKYGAQRSTFKLVHDPYTTLFILIIQEFLEHKDLNAAQMAFHMLSLRTYSNTLRNFTTPKSGGNNRKSICIPDIFETALEHLSANHIFKVKKTIPNAIIYFSTYIFNKYRTALETDDSDEIFTMIYALKNRIKQSIRSFMNKYYDIYKKKTSNTTKDEESYNTATETKLRDFIERVSEDMCIYRKMNNYAYEMATNITKFNKQLSKKYVQCLAQPSFKDKVSTAYYLLLRDVKDMSVVKTMKFIDYIRALMSIKTTKQVLYYKKVIDEIQLQIVDELNLHSWYNSLTIQSKAVGRNFIAYYLALYLRYYI